MFYAFPPFSMILHVLRKATTDRATGVLICPIWATQSWYPLLMRMLIAKPLILPLDVLHLPFKEGSRHPKRDLRLMACHISGNSTSTKDFLMTQSMSSAHLGGNQHQNNTKSILKSGFLSVIDGRLIPFQLMK